MEKPGPWPAKGTRDIECFTVHLEEPREAIEEVELEEQDDVPG